MLSAVHAVLDPPIIAAGPRCARRLKGRSENHRNPPPCGDRAPEAHTAGIERRRNHRGTRVGRLGKRAAAVGLPKKCHHTARFTE